MKKVKLEVVGLSYSQTQLGAYALVLSEISGTRRLPIVVGSPEAQAIALEMEKMAPPSRPLTHDLFKTFAISFGIRLKEVVIYNLLEGIFYAKLVCEDDNKQVEIDSRTSDAVALALRFDCPIYTYDSILEVAGIVVDGSEMDVLDDIESEIDKNIEALQAENEFVTIADDELEALLSQALIDEDYERAAKIRDELNTRKGEV